MPNASDELESQGPRHSGRWAILSIAAVAIALTALAWWYWYSIGRRALDYWGVESALLIQTATDVELLELSSETTAGETVAIGGTTYAIVGHRDLQKDPVPGFMHVRASFLRDAAYAWNEPAGECRPMWQYALRFKEGERLTILLISLACPRVAALQGNTVTPPRSIRPIAPGLEAFFAQTKNSRGQE